MGLQLVTSANIGSATETVRLSGFGICDPGIPKKKSKTLEEADERLVNLLHGMVFGIEYEEFHFLRPYRCRLLTSSRRRSVRLGHGVSVKVLSEEVRMSSPWDYQIIIDQYELSDSNTDGAVGSTGSRTEHLLYLCLDQLFETEDPSGETTLKAKRNNDIVIHPKMIKRFGDWDSTLHRMKQLNLF